MSVYYLGTVEVFTSILAYVDTDGIHIHWVGTGDFVAFCMLKYNNL